MSIQGKTVVFTGKISKPRHEFQALVESHGGISGSDVSSNTDYLVVGEKPGSKLFRAISLGVPRISEEEFLKLLETTEVDETPLPSEALRELESHMVTIECSFCHKTYRQWDTLPNYETCPVCEILSHPICPHCGNDPTFVTDFNLYKCTLCGTWFKAPYSIHARFTRHLHLWVKAKQTPTGVVKRCLCGASITLSNEELQHNEELYEKAPSLVKNWEEDRKEREEAGKKEKKAFEFLNSLSQEQLDQLGGQLNG